ncbi:MAG TPA: 2Fe-2S iron-sulfur cluster-binding protein [Burkholderiaceae bacterium]
MPDVGKRFHIVITPNGWHVEAADAITILDAALLGDIKLPSSCRNGTCRTCMCRLISGQVSYRIEWPGLSADEKKEGYVLPCVAYPESDLVIEVPGAVSLSIANDENPYQID